ncbi:MAG: serine hydrolase [Candidatus Heimdallarchaeota archaeon]
MNDTKKLTEIIIGTNKEEINRRILKIENSIVGISHKSSKKDENGLVIEGVPYPNFNEKKNIYEIMEMDNIPGCCIALINNYEIEWLKCYGERKIGTQDKITVKTLFQAASISKVLISLMALHLVDKNLLALDEPINNKLKDWKIPESDFTKDKEITIKHVLTHTSGINPPTNGFSYEKGSIPTIDQVLKGEAPAKNDPVKVEFEPESKHQYSNLGFIVVEKLLQDVYNKKTNDIAKEIIFDPLGITNSYFDFPSEELQKQMIYPHDGSGKAYEPHVGLSPSIFGCGGLITTSYDLAKIAIELMKAYQGKSNKIISPSIAKKCSLVI